MRNTGEKEKSLCVISGSLTNWRPPDLCMEWVRFRELRRQHVFHAVLVLSLSETSHSCSSELSPMPFYFVFYLLVLSLPASDLSGYTPKGGRLSWREYLPSAMGRWKAGYYR